MFLLVVGMGAMMPEMMACPGCRTAGDVVKQTEAETVTASFAMSASVLFLLAFVLGALSFLGLYIRKTVARLDSERMVP